MSTPTKLNGTAINFGTITGIVGTLTVIQIAFYDAATAGNLKVTAVLAPSRPLVDGDTLNFAIGSVAFTSTGGGGSVEGNALALNILDALFGSTTLGPSTYYAALMTAAPTGVGGGTEIPTSGTSYARVSITNNPTNWPAASLI